MEAHPPAHLSQSRLSTYDRCPALFRDRYILKLAQPPSVERQFGIAVHKGIEAHYRGLDHEMAYLLDWRNSVKDCKSTGLFVPPYLTARGLELIDMVRSLNLTGETERRITLTTPGIPIPIIGYVDLWTGTTIYDFKTTGATWGPARLEKEVFQPAIYTLALALELEQDFPKFEFICLPRMAGQMQRLDATRTVHQVYGALERAREIFRLIEQGEFGCICKQHQEVAA